MKWLLMNKTRWAHPQDYYGANSSFSKTKSIMDENNGHYYYITTAINGFSINRDIIMLQY